MNFYEDVFWGIQFHYQRDKTGILMDVFADKWQSANLNSIN